VPPFRAAIYIFNSTALLCVHPCDSDVGVLCITEKCYSRSVLLKSKTLRLSFLFFLMKKTGKRKITDFFKVSRHNLWNEREYLQTTHLIGS
jgi:hypothetical protein